MPKSILVIALLFFLAAFQLSFFSILPLINNLNFILLLVLYLSTKKNYFFIPAAVIGGWLLDMYSSFTFGTQFLALAIIAALSNFIYFRFLAGHRFFPFMLLTALCIVIYRLIVRIIVAALDFLKIAPHTAASAIDLSRLAKEISLSVIFISLIYLASKISRKSILAVFIPVRKQGS